MSMLAMAAYHRLRVDRRYRLTGTARLVLYHLCWRHDEVKDVAWPSTADIASSLDLHRSAVTGALARLRSARLITREGGGGRSKSTRYRLRFLAAHRVDPRSKQPIDWHYKQSSLPDSLGPKLSSLPDSLESETVAKLSSLPDSLEPETVRQRRQNCPAAATETVLATGHKRHKDIKTRPPAVAEGAGGRPRTADDVFRERYRQRELALLAAVEGEVATCDQAGPNKAEEAEAPAGEEAQARNRELAR